MRILGIETSCDETAAAVVEYKDGPYKNFVLQSNVVASSVDLHTVYGGVVPEIAARSHLEHINPVINQALHEALGSQEKKTRSSLLKAHSSDDLWSSIDAIAVTQGPGLGGCLLIGVLSARTLAILHGKPLYAVNHVEAHPYAVFINEISSTMKGTSHTVYHIPYTAPAFPMLALIVSGGHSHLVLFEDHFKYQVLGRTLDDAIGEAFDKVAKIIGLPYPGGPSIEKVAIKGDPDCYKLPLAKLESEYDFSFSGLKTATLRLAQQEIGQDYTFPSHQIAEHLSKKQQQDIATAFQKAAFGQILVSLDKAYKKFAPKSVVVSGGVAASKGLRQMIAKELKIDAIYPEIRLCTDNGAMIAAHACFQLDRDQKPADPYRLEFLPDLKM